MTNAVEAVISGSVGYLMVSEQFGVPHTALECHVKEKRINPASMVSRQIGRYQCVFTSEQEAE